MFRVPAQDDVGTTTGHIGGDRHGTTPSGLGDDFRFSFVLLGVQHIVLDASFYQLAADMFGRFDGRRAHQNRSSGLVDFLNLQNDGIPFFFVGAVDVVRMVDSLHNSVGWYSHHVQLIYLPELFRFGHCRSGHPGQLAV